MLNRAYGLVSVQVDAAQPSRCLKNGAVEVNGILRDLPPWREHLLVAKGLKVARVWREVEISIVEDTRTAWRGWTVRRRCE